ncbi:MAG: DUF433 domain-containing protein [Acidobacteriota bacterium]|nr:MAG: DUF433 domain-containing protein [Acidobacteriota bacterium]
MASKKKLARKAPPGPPITVDAGGVAWISGTQVKVIEIVFDKLAHGGSARDVKARFPRLTLRQISAALSYFRENQDLFRSEVERRWKMISQLGIREADSPFQRRLKLLTKK